MQATIVRLLTLCRPGTYLHSSPSVTPVRKDRCNARTNVRSWLDATRHLQSYSETLNYQWHGPWLGANRRLSVVCRQWRHVIRRHQGSLPWVRRSVGRPGLSTRPRVDFLQPTTVGLAQHRLETASRTYNGQRSRDFSFRDDRELYHNKSVVHFLAKKGCS